MWSGAFIAELFSAIVPLNALQRTLAGFTGLWALTFECESPLSLASTSAAFCTCCKYL